MEFNGRRITDILNDTPNTETEFVLQRLCAFYQRESNTEIINSEFNDLTNIELACSTSEDDEYEIQISIDIIDMMKVVYIDGIEYESESFESIDDIVEYIDCFNFEYEVPRYDDEYMHERYREYRNGVLAEEHFEMLRELRYMEGLR